MKGLAAGVLHLLKILEIPEENHEFYFFFYSYFNLYVCTYEIYPYLKITNNERKKIIMHIHCIFTF